MCTSRSFVFRRHLQKMRVPTLTSVPFVPIKDIEGYIGCLRRDGVPEDELQRIREKHTAALPPPPPPTVKKWHHGYEFLDDIKVTLAVQGDRVRLKWTAPFEDLRKHMYTGKPIPLAVRVKCLLKAGAPDDVVKAAIKRNNDWFSADNQKKQQQILDRIFGVAPVKKVLKSVKKKPL